jgi:hypothetical protein
MRRRLLCLLLAVLLVALAAPLASAAERCARSCHADVAACRRSKCGSERGAARRDCIEKRCRGPLGCPTRIRTLAYVVTRCKARDGRLVGSQELQIRRGDCDPVTVLPLETPGEVGDPLKLCELVGRNRQGFNSGLAGVFQRLAVTPDGSGVVFEVTNEFELIGKTPLAAEQQGFFYVRADGSGLRRLGPPSADPTWRIDSNARGEPVAAVQTYLSFSPSGRLVVYTDCGPGPDGDEAPQLFTLDVATGRRTQVTRLPKRTPPVIADERSVGDAVFLDEHTIRFNTRSQEEGRGNYTSHTIGTDGSGLRRGPPQPRIPSRDHPTGSRRCSGSPDRRAVPSPLRWRRHPRTRIRTIPMPRRSWRCSGSTAGTSSSSPPLVAPTPAVWVGDTVTLPSAAPPSSKRAGCSSRPARTRSAPTLQQLSALLR